MTPRPSVALPLLLLAACSQGELASTADSSAPSSSKERTDGAGTDVKEASGLGSGRTPAAPSETRLAAIPARFVGTWAPDARACAAGYDYQPAFQRIDIKPDRIGFFETVGEVQAVAEAGGSTRVTLRERVGDATPVYPVMLSLADGGRALNYLRDGRRDRLVKCSG